MTIVFRKLNVEENKILRNSLMYWLNDRQYEDFIQTYHFIIGEGKWKEIFLIKNDMKKFLVNYPLLTPYTIGLGLGEIKHKDIFLSLSGASVILQFTKKKVIISPEAEQPFLYKKNILVKSVLKCSKDLQKNDKLLVSNEKGDFLGIGQLKIQVSELPKEKNADKLAVLNILDLGWYLRKGK